MTARQHQDAASDGAVKMTYAELYALPGLDDDGMKPGSDASANEATAAADAWAVYMGDQTPAEFMSRVRSGYPAAEIAQYIAAHPLARDMGGADLSALVDLLASHVGAWAR